MAGKEGFTYKAVEINKKVDLVTMGLGVVAGSAPVVFFGMLSYIASGAIQNKLNNKNG